MPSYSVTGSSSLRFNWGVSTVFAFSVITEMVRFGLSSCCMFSVCSICFLFSFSSCVSAFYRI